MDNERVNLVISGYVQGVFFRASTREMALGLGLNGWVKNLLNGNVEAVFEGNMDKIEQAIQWCNHGPPGAQVTRIVEKRGEFKGEFESFIVKY